MPTTSIQLDNELDLALLSVDDLPGFERLRISLTDPVVGDSVFVSGNPSGLQGSFSQGIVSGIRQVGRCRLLQITAPISPGSSGGPVVNTNCGVVGVAVSQVANGQNLNFAVHVMDLRSFLCRFGEITPATPNR